MKQNEVSKHSKQYYDNVNIDIYSNGLLFIKIKSEITNDLVEAITIMMKDKCFDGHEIWNTKIPKHISCDNIDVEKCIYWLTGGNKAWDIKNGMYNTKWIDIASDYEYIIGSEIKVLFKKSKTFGDLRDRLTRKFPMIRIMDLAVFFNIIK